LGIIAVNVTAAFNRIKAHARRHKIPLDPLADRVSMTPRRAISATEKKLSYRLAASSRAEHPADPRHLVGRTLLQENLAAVGLALPEDAVKELDNVASIRSA
jgi:hypothetical protein